jgi:Bacterial alpha-L-rhamnosidase C-terminal domain/Bacterial alpha-L-rhamnosidase 6 hairpin glycosidase domain
VDFDSGDFLAIAVYSDMEQTGQFECSNPDINRLLENTRWSMKGNFLDVPTDCPTREIAEVIGNEPDARLFAEYATGAKNAYEYLFLQGSSVDTDRQAKLVRPLALGLADGATRTALQERLVRFVIAPVPGGTLSYASACYESVYGSVSSKWENNGGSLRFTISIPANATAEIVLPDGGRSMSFQAGPTSTS